MTVKKKRRFVKLLLLNIIFIVLCFACLIPILYALSVSFSASNNLLSTSFSFIPHDFTLDNFRQILFEKPFFVWLKNSALLSVCTMVVALGVSVIGAYAYSRLRFKGRNIILYILLILNAFPSILSMFAMYRILKPMGLVNSYLGLIIIYTGTMAIFGVWNLKGYFDTIPVEIEEAGRIDGANDFQVVSRIVLPLARPSIIVTAMMILIFVWNEYIFAVTFMTGADKYTLAAGLYSLQATEYTRNWPMFSAASLLVSLPILIIFFAVQKHMVSGLTAGGVKG